MQIHLENLSINGKYDLYRNTRIIISNIVVQEYSILVGNTNHIDSLYRSDFILKPTIDLDAARNKLAGGKGSAF